MFEQINNLTGCKRQVVTMLLIIVSIFGCVSVTVIGLDAACYRDVTAWLPVYPDAEIISQSNEFFRPWAMGRTNMLLYTDDDYNTVNRWYIEQLTAVSAVQPDRGIARTDWRLRRDAERGGTLIQLSSECAR